MLNSGASLSLPARPLELMVHWSADAPHGFRKRMSPLWETVICTIGDF